MRSPKLRASVLIVLAVALVASSCTKKDAGLSIKKANAAAKTGGTMVLGIVRPNGLDPSDPADPNIKLVLDAICDRLVEFDPITGEPRKALLQTWTPSSKGTSVRGRLRKRIPFHNDKEVIAEDSSFSFSRIADKDTASSVSDLVANIEGYATLHEEQATDEAESQDKQFQKLLVGFAVREKYTFEITIKPEFGELYRVFGSPLGVPLPRRVVDKDQAAFERKPVCMGPYELTEPYTRASQSIKVRRFSKYYGQNEAFTRGGKGYADTIEFKLYNSQEEVYQAYRRGEVEIADVPGDKVNEAKGLGDQLKQTATHKIEYLGLPTDKKPFDKPAVRVALSMALDRHALADPRNVAVATGFTTPALGKLYDKKICGKNVPSAPDVAGAKALLQKAGVDLSGVTAKMYYNNDPGIEPFMQAVAAQWKAAFGLTLEPTPMQWEAYAEASARPGFDGPFRTAWEPEYASYDRYLFPLFNSNSIGQNNWSRYSDRLFDHDIEKEARRSDDDIPRDRFYTQLETRLCLTMPMIPVYYWTRPMLFNTAKLGSAVDAYFDVPTVQPLIRELYVKG